MKNLLKRNISAILTAMLIGISGISVFAFNFALEQRHTANAHAVSAGELRGILGLLLSEANKAILGNEEAFDKLDKLTSSFDATLKKKLIRLSEQGFSENSKKIDLLWAQWQSSVYEILASKNIILAKHGSDENIIRLANGLIQTNKIITSIANGSSDYKEVGVLAEYNIVLINRVLSTYYSDVKPSLYSELVTEQLIEDIALYEKNYIAINQALSGNIQGVDEFALKEFKESEGRFSQLVEDIGLHVDNSDISLSAKQALEVMSQSYALFNASIQNLGGQNGDSVESKLTRYSAMGNTVIGFQGLLLLILLILSIKNRQPATSTDVIPLYLADEQNVQENGSGNDIDRQPVRECLQYMAGNIFSQHNQLKLITDKIIGKTTELVSSCGKLKKVIGRVSSRSNTLFNSTKKIMRLSSDMAGVMVNTALHGQSADENSTRIKERLNEVKQLILDISSADQALSESDLKKLISTIETGEQMVNTCIDSVESLSKGLTAMSSVVSDISEQAKQSQTVSNGLKDALRVADKYSEENLTASNQCQAQTQLLHEIVDHMKMNDFSGYQKAIAAV